jgi:amidase
MGFKSPDLNDLKTAAASMGQDLNETRLEEIIKFLGPFAEGYKYLDEKKQPLPELKYPVRSYRDPDPRENKYGAWQVICDLKGSGSGPLKGRRVAIKDNIFVAHVPMVNGTEYMRGFRPEFDATVVTRLLDAGAHIAGKSTCEYMCISGGSATASRGIVGNPHRLGYSAGGSSSGSAVLVGSGQIDLALGCDQAGSIRIPASFCGAYGMKATHGLIPYTGILGMESMLDNVGPITSNVADSALMLEVLAGYDGLDTRQGQLQLHKYTDALEQDFTGMKIGVVKEGFSHPLGDNEVDLCVRQASERLRKIGFEIEDVSIPMHPEGVAIWGAIVTDGIRETLSNGGNGYNLNGLFSPALFEVMKDWESKLDEFPINVQLVMLLAKYMEQYKGEYYGKAKNLLIPLRQAYDDALADFDLLLMPTCVQTPFTNPESQAEQSSEDIVSAAFNTILNTCQFDITGHPAMSLPCGTRGGVPVGMMLIGKHYDEPTIYRAANGFEQSKNWREF